LEFVEHGRSGLVVQPEAEALGRAINELYANRERAREMGEAGRPAVSGIGWDRVVESLTSPLR
jgi:glycosyltransferase involved in cell wall biosynthesis